MGKIAGIFMIVLGILQGIWIGYKLLPESCTKSAVNVNLV